MPVTLDNGVYIGQMSPDDIWRQASSEYEARANNPRSDVFGRTLAADKPEALREELFAPLQEWASALAGARSGGRRGYDDGYDDWKLINTPTGVLRINDRTGQTSMVQPNQPTDRIKLERLSGLNDRLRVAQANVGNRMYDQKLIQAQINEIQNQINSINSGTDNQPAGTAELFAPSAYIGGAGQPNRMEWNSGMEPGTAFAGSTGGDNLFQSAPTQTTTPTGQRVRVRSPQGKVGTIPAEQLEEALANGYTRVK